MNNKLSAKTLTTTFLATAAIAGQAQVINGSFENGVAYTAGPNIFAAGTPAPWVATSFTPDCYDNTGTDGWGLAGIPQYNNMFQGMAASNGHRFIGFAAGQTFNESFGETLTPLISGTSYTVSADMAVDDLGKAVNFGGPYLGRGPIDVRLNGSSIGQFGGNTASLTWQSRSVTFVAPTASSYFLEFVALQDGLLPPQLPSYVGLDNVQMAAVPEPTTLLGMGTALLGLALRRRRSR